MRFKGFLSKILSSIGHLVALAILGWAIFPLAKFYFSGLSTFGDWFVGYTFADYIKNHFALPPASWVYSLKTGAPFFTFYQWFHFYLMQPLVHLLGTAWGMETYSFAALLLFYLFSYLLFWELSKNQFFSAFLTVILYYSLGVSEALMRGGFITQNACQFLLPLVLWLIVLFYQKKDKRLLVLAAIFSGLALLGHVGISAFLIFAPTGLALFFWWDEKTKLLSWQKIKDSFVYGLTALLVGLPAVLVAISWKLSGGGKSICQDLTCVARIEGLRQYFNIWSLIVMLAMIGIAIIWSLLQRRNCFKRAIPFFAFLGFIFAYLGATRLKLGIVSALSTVLWPLRTVWVVSLGMEVAAAVLFGEIRGKDKISPLAKGLRTLLATTAFGLMLWMIIAKPYDLLPLFSRTRWVYENSGPSFVRYTVDKYKTGPYQNFDRSMIFPDWLPLDDTNYRIDDLMHEIYGHWPLAAKMPIIRAYGGATAPKFDDWRSWWTSAETDQLGEEEMRDKGRLSTFNQALFLIDWYAIRYFNASINFIERDHPYAPFMMNEAVVDKHQEIKVTPHHFDFWRIREEITSPIIKATNVPVVLVVGSDLAYNNFIRSLGISNTNSQELIPARGPQKLEDLKINELKDFDLVVLSQYQYGNFRKAWRILERFVEEGGSLFIDTGAEVKESDSQTLPLGIKEMPAVFPTRATKREPLGRNWDLVITDSLITEGINFDKFSPLLFDDAFWKLSFVPEDSGLRKGAEVILRQSGHPILVTQRLGEGKVIWSGLSLPYYALHYQAVEEAKLLRQIVAWGTDGLGETKPEFIVERLRPEKVEVSGNDFKGVLFKENFDSGWRAKVNGKKVKVYPAGIDFMYVGVPELTKGPIKVEITYRGTLLNCFLFIISLTSLAVALKYALTGSLIKIKGESLEKVKVARKIKSWWESEEE